MKRLKLFAPGILIAAIGGAAAKWLDATAGTAIIGAAGVYFAWIREQPAFARKKRPPLFPPEEPTPAERSPQSPR